MLMPPPGPTQLASIKQDFHDQVSSDPSTKPFVTLLAVLVPMIYEGNADAAKRLLHDVWSDDLNESFWSTPDEMWDEIWSVIDSGPYGTFIRGLNAH